jgi:hypothetical protein
LAPFVKTADILFVPDLGGHDASWLRPYYMDALAALRYGCDTWDTQLRCAPASTILARYADGAVIWVVPEDWSYLTLGWYDSVSQLQAYLDAGGRLFITGQEIAEILAWRGGAGFLKNYLHATYVQADTALYALAGAAGDPIGDGLALNISGGDGANNQYAPDEVDALAPAEVIFSYHAGAGAAPAGCIGTCTAGLRVDADAYKVVFFAFGFEAISRAADREAVMGRVLDWLELRRPRHYLPVVVVQRPTADSLWVDRAP